MLLFLFFVCFMLSIFFVFFFFFFFFSSRRRHTRLVSDWSSDVCSSDLCVEVSARVRAGYNCSDSSLVLGDRSEEHTSELQSLTNLVCRLLLEKKKKAPTMLIASLAFIGLFTAIS